MLLFSLIITPTGPLSEIWFLKDYWRRPTITGYPISVEDAIKAWYMGCNPLGWRLSGINIEELLWDFTWGLAGGTIVEVVTGETLQKRSS